MEIPLTQHIKYVCPECSAIQKTYRQWLQHLQEKHDFKKKSYKELNFEKFSNEYYQCLKCKRRMVTRDTSSIVLYMHHITHLPSVKVFKCVYCAYGTSHQTEIGAHLKSIHNQKLQHAAKTKINSDYRNPKSNSEFYMRFQCPLCKQVMNEFDSWLTHINTTHKSTSTHLNMKKIANTNNYYCLTCKRMFYTNDQTVLQRHRFTHLHYPEYYKCAYCSASKTTKMDVFNHFMENHKRIFEGTKKFIKKPNEWGNVNGNNGKEIDNNVRYVCFECESEFENQEECLSHISNDHEFDIQKNFRKLKPHYYQCLKCKQNLMSNRVDELKKHNLSHIPYRSYLKCVHCEIMEQDSESMLYHLKHECRSKPLAKNSNLLKKISPPMNLFSQPYDFQEISKHLKQSHSNIIKIAANISN